MLITFRDSKLKIYSLRDFLWLQNSNFFLGIILSSSFISAAGLPPFVGFFSKIYAIFPVMELELKVVAIILIMWSMLAAYYYLRITALMFFKGSGEIYLLNKPSVKVCIILSVILYFSSFMLFNPMALCNLLDFIEV